MRTTEVSDRMDDPLRAAYYATDADAVTTRWRDGERPFALTAGDPSDPAGALDGRLDAVVCHAGEWDARPVIESARDRSAHLPVVVFDAGDALDAAAALDLDVTRVLAVDDEDDPVELLAALDPLLERHREHRRERSMLDSLLENIPLSVYFKDRQSRHVRVSDELASMVDPPYVESPDGKRHHAPADFRGKTDYDLYPPALAESAVRDDRRVVETEEPIEGRIENAYGGPLDGMFVATSKAPWYDADGRVAGVVGVTRDISERKHYENQLERQNERLERFASVISHDLRNPLEVAMGRLELAREDGVDDHADAIERALERIDALIEDVLTLARQGETVSDPVPTDLAVAAADAWRVVDSGAATLDVRTEATVFADPSRLRQLFENLFRNSVEHGPDDVTVTVGDLPNRSGFFVADDGPGIPEEDRDAVFDSGFSTSDEGTGLGLSIVRTIAEAHGWDVTATESDGGGSSDERGVSGAREGRGASGARFEIANVRPVVEE